MREKYPWAKTKMDGETTIGKRGLLQRGGKVVRLWIRLTKGNCKPSCFPLPSRGRLKEGRKSKEEKKKTGKGKR